MVKTRNNQTYRARRCKYRLRTRWVGYYRVKPILPPILQKNQIQNEPDQVKDNPVQEDYLTVAPDIEQSLPQPVFLPIQNRYSDEKLSYTCGKPCKETRFEPEYSLGHYFSIWVKRRRRGKEGKEKIYSCKECETIVHKQLII
jgi:hypothetical protein